MLIKFLFIVFDIVIIILWIVVVLIVNVLLIFCNVFWFVIYYRNIKSFFLGRIGFILLGYVLLFVRECIIEFMIK